MEHNMIEEKLEIVIPTYNRAKYLDNLLSHLLNSPFKNCRITVNDNASSDETPEICKKYHNLLPNIILNRRRENIGGDANIMNCFESTSTKYGWVLGDDDDYDFSKCDDLIEVIENEDFDLIFVCSAGYLHSNGETINKILKNNSDSNDKSYLKTDALSLVKLLDIHYFFNMSLLSGFIYQTKLWNSDSLIKGYNNIHNMYSQYPLIAKSVEENLSIYKTEHEIIKVSNKENVWDQSMLYWVISWLDSATMIKDKCLQKKAANFLEGSGFKVAIGSVIIAKSLESEDLSENLIKLNMVMKKLHGYYKGALYSFVIKISSLIPKSLCKMIYKKYQINNSRK